MEYILYVEEGFVHATLFGWSEQNADIITILEPIFRLGMVHKL